MRKLPLAAATVAALALSSVAHAQQFALSCALVEEYPNNPEFKASADQGRAIRLSFDLARGLFCYEDIFPPDDPTAEKMWRSNGYCDTAERIVSVTSDAILLRDEQTAIVDDNRNVVGKETSRVVLNHLGGSYRSDYRIDAPGIDPRLSWRKSIGPCKIIPYFPVPDRKF